MEDTDTTGLVAIGRVVAELAAEYPDISHSSLRFLEREGLLVPTRTTGGHRLYGPAHINRLRQIKEWQRQHLTLAEIRQRLQAADELGDPDELAHEFLRLALAGDQIHAQRLILETDALGMPLQQLFEDVLERALYWLGDGWAAGEITVAQEKEVSAVVRDLVAELSLRHSSTDFSEAVIVAACAPGEHHELGLRMVAGLLRSHGYQVHYLGPAVDPAFLVESVRLRRPRVVLISATMDAFAPGIERSIDALRESIDSVDLPVIVVGGQIIDGSRDLIASWGAVPAREPHIADTVRAVESAMQRDSS
jgi:DNA-binding transcriptional MerR regulator/methylmalonyl-CoA mutase cobalamin-binding subunit